MAVSAEGFTTGSKLSPQGSSPHKSLPQPCCAKALNSPIEKVADTPVTETNSSVAWPHDPPVFQASAPQPLVIASVVPQRPVFQVVLSWFQVLAIRKTSLC
jgi:hypothetical protein